MRSSTKEIEELLKAEGVDYKIKNGKKHKKVYIQGTLVQVVPRLLTNSRFSTERASRNAITHIKAFIARHCPKAK